MSTPRNRTPRPSRVRNTAAVLGAIIAPIAASIAACAPEAVTSPPAAASSPSMSLLPITPKASAADDANRTTLGALSGLAANWHTTPSALESGSEHPLDLTCSVSQRSSASQLIGPQGGVLRLGAHSLTVPKGALATTVLISATATVGPSVRIDFAPHGLQFAKAATLVLNYTGCTMPSTGAGNVYYTNEFDAIRQSMPSANDPATKTITALTDHFSGYLVGWGRY